MQSIASTQSMYSYALTLYNKGEHQLAKQQLEKLLKIQPKHSAALSMLALIYQAKEDLQNALKYYDKCLSVDPTSVMAMHNKAIVLRRQAKYQDAVELSKAAIKLRPAVGDIHQNLGSSYAAMGKVDLAIASFERALQLEPLNVSHHHWLNQLLWTEGKKEFLNSYLRAIESAPQSHHVRRELVYKLTLAGRLEEAGEHSEYLLAKESGNPMNSKLYGVVLRKQRKFEEAVKVHLQATRLDPNNMSYREELVTSYLGCGDHEAALPLVNKLIEEDKLHQGYLALKATALRIAGSEEYHYLCDYEKLVLRTEIEPPPGYASLAEFNRDLADHLSDLHTNKEHPIDQSLVHGTQTTDDLFKNPGRMVQLLKACFDKEMYHFLRQLPADETHPTLVRNNHEFTCTGAWSVLLRSSGFHRNHFHSHGWYSGPYYVDLPDAVNNEEEKQGWVKFGEPGFESVVSLPPDLIVKPEPGLMVRFPSFMWHGTIPFKSDASRMVVALDLLPK